MWPKRSLSTAGAGDVPIPLAPAKDGGSRVITWCALWGVFASVGVVAVQQIFGLDWSVLLNVHGYTY